MKDVIYFITKGRETFVFIGERAVFRAIDGIYEFNFPPCKSEAYPSASGECQTRRLPGGLRIINALTYHAPGYIPGTDIYLDEYDSMTSEVIYSSC